MRMISSSKLSSCVYFQPHHTVQVKMLSFNDVSGRNLLSSSRTGWMWQAPLDRVQKLPDLCFGCLKNLRRPQAESLTNSEAFRILSRLDWGSYSSLQDGLNQALHNHMSFATVKAILFATKAMPLSCSPEKNLERETCRTWHFFLSVLKQLKADALSSCFCVFLIFFVEMSLPPRRLGNFGKKAARVNRFSPKFDKSSEEAKKDSKVCFSNKKHDKNSECEVIISFSIKQVFECSTG